MQETDQIAGSSANDAEYVEIPRTDLPATVAFQDEKMLVTIYHHRLNYPREEVYCWTYVSDGMWQHRQKDIVFALKCLPEEMDGDRLRVPKRPVVFLHTVCKLAMQGRPVDAGGYTEFGQAGMLVGDFKGAIYVEPEYYRGVTLPAMGALAAVLVYEEELEVVKRGGLTRIAARLGQDKLYFPTARWTDRCRPPLPLLQETIAKSVHLNTPTAFVQGSAVMQNNVVTLQLPRGTHPHFARLAEMPLQTPFTLALQPDPSANACLVWKPDGAPTASIVRDQPPVVKTSGTYIGFGPKLDHPATLGIVEDGYLMRASDETLAGIRTALMEGQPYHAGGFEVFPEFRIEWIDRSLVHLPYPRPMLQPSPEELDRPDILPGPTLISEPVVALFSVPDDVAEHIGIGPLYHFLQRIDRAIFDIFAPLPKGTAADLAVYFRVFAHEKFAVIVSFRGPDRAATDALNPQGAALTERIRQLPGPPLNGRQPIAFAYIVGIGAGSGQRMFTVF